MTADQDYVLLPGPCVWLVALVSAVQPTRGTEARRPSSLPSLSPAHISGAMHLVEHRPSCAAKGCGCSPCCSLCTKQGAKPCEGLPCPGQFWLWPAQPAAPQGRGCTAGCTSYQGQASTPKQMSFFLNEKDFAILSSEYVALIDIYWALRDPSLSSLAWLIGIIERRPALAGWDSPLLGWSSPARPALLLCSLAPVRLN